MHHFVIIAQITFLKIYFFLFSVYYAIKNNRETHFFEDLTPRGYVIRPRTTGYNEDETRLLFKRLGEYHAASYIFTESVSIKHQTEPVFFQQNTYNTAYR